MVSVMCGVIVCDYVDECVLCVCVSGTVVKVRGHAVGIIFLCHEGSSNQTLLVRLGDKCLSH